MPDVSSPDSDSSETNLVIITRRDRFMLFCKLYWRVLVIVLTPIILMPIAFIGHNNAYKCFYVFLVTATYWMTDAIHPSIAALVPVALSSVMGNSGFISEMYVRNELLDCVGIMLIIIAIEQSQIHKRLALKLLLIFGCSHYRLSFLLFFLTLFLSMWISGIIACGLMMPLVKAVLIELERMGILEIYQTIGKARQKTIRHGEKCVRNFIWGLLLGSFTNFKNVFSNLRPTDFTIFYFLGIAYSSSIGSMATIIGSQSNQILKVYCEMLFPVGPKIEFPHFMLLNLPGVLVLETILYFWMNFYFLGMCRAHSDISFEIGMTEEESQYINTLLAAQYKQMGRITFHESIILIIIIITALMQATISSAHIDEQDLGKIHRHFRVSSPCMLCAVLLFILPRDLSFVKFFKKLSEEHREPLPQTASKTCLNWLLVKQNFNWSVLFIVGGSATLFESLRDSGMTEELEKFLMLGAQWPSAALILVIIIFFKILTEFAPNSCVVYSLLPHVARLGLRSSINPHYLMMAASLSCSLPFHLVTGSPVNALVAAYVYIAPSKMPPVVVVRTTKYFHQMKAGIGISIASVVVAWFTIAAWAKAVWNDNYGQPEWAKINLFNKELEL